MQRHKFKGRLSLILALFMIFSVVGLTLTSCEYYDDYDDYGIPDYYEEETQEEFYTSENETESSPEQEQQTEPETEQQTESETQPETESETQPETEPEPDLPDEDGTYDDKDCVALYIHTYGKLPPNYITKKEAENLGWSGGSLEKYAEGKCIGGSKFGNYEGLLPKAKGRQYYECDIDTLGEKSRGAKRIVYSNDGLIYYTDDHYETFELLYGEEDDG